MKKHLELKGRKAVITGGSHGIGKALVEALAEAGVEVVFVDKDEPEFSSKAQFIQADLTAPKEIENFCEQTLKSTGTPDILILNAGRGIQQRLDEGNPDQWENILQLNIMSGLRLINRFLPLMKKQDFADVVVTSSVSSFHPYQTGSVYSATKAALDNVAEVLRLENIPQIRVTTIAPGVVNTQFFKNNIDGQDDVESLNMGAVEPEEVADAIIYAITRRKGISLNYMVIRPTGQEM